MNNIKKSQIIKWIILGPLSVIGVLVLIVFIFAIGKGVVEDVTYSTSYYGGTATKLSDYEYGSESYMMAEVPEADYDYFESDTRSPKETLTLDDGTEVDTKIIKTGTLELVVDDVDETADIVSSIASDNEGYVQSTNFYEQTDGTRYGTITIRIPVENFESVLAGIKGYAEVVERESVSADDVTEDYVDLLARLNNAETQEQIYLSILDMAKTVEDVLLVQNELQDIRELIERYQGRLTYLENQTSLSTISITLSEEPVVKIAGKEFRPGTTVKLAVQALVVFVQQLVNAVIWIMLVGGGIAILFGLLGTIGYKGGRKLWCKLKQK